ncbi:MAG TPA: tRNA epoxyqueuosine(34) reductase QueG [Vicinamibacterales bacterium]
MLTVESVKNHARALGFDLCGVAPVETFPELGRIREWIARGYAGDMGYLPRTASKREDVRRVLPSARSVIVTGIVYNVDRPYSAGIEDAGQAIVSRYAWGDDYHDVIGCRLDRLLAWMRAQHDTPFEALTYVDTGPVHERVYAQYAGLGWIGKNGCLINPRLGSWLFLSEIVCSLTLEADAPALDQCGTCMLCLEACPTGALVEPHVLDARRCLSYLTIELRREIPESLRTPVGAHVYGCDICQDVCPWNQAAARSEDPAWQPRKGLDHPRLVDLWRRSDEGLASLVRGSAMTRATITGLRRNLAVALGNSADPELASALDAPRADTGTASLDDRMVQEHLRWARAKHALE